MDLTQKLSPHFSLGEMTRTSHREYPNMPGEPELYALTRLCVWVLEPLRIEFGPLWVDSGYRSPLVNSIVGGKLRSMHIMGCAADLFPLWKGVTIDSMMAWLAGSGLPFDQAISETNAHGNCWLHVGIALPGSVSAPRHELLVSIAGIESFWKGV